MEEVEKKKEESPKKLKSLFCSELASAVVMFENYNEFSLSSLVKNWPGYMDIFLQSASKLWVLCCPCVLWSVPKLRSHGSEIQAQRGSQSVLATYGNI